MKLRQFLIFVVLGVTVWFAFFASPPSDMTVDEVARKNKPAKPSTPIVSTAAGNSQLKLSAIVDRRELIEVDEKTKVSTLFDQQNWNPPPPTPALEKPVASPTPVAPTMPFQYIGKKIEDGTYEVYLASGDKTYAVVVGTVIENTYKVDAIKPPLMYLTYLPLNQSQTISIGSGE